MSIFFMRRALKAFATLFELTFVIFLLARLVGDPVPLIRGTEATPQDIQFYRRQYGLDQPLMLQYLTFLANIVRGDFGVSFRYRVPAIELVMPALWASFKLTSVAMILSVLIGVPLGIFGSIKPRGWVSRVVGWYSAAGGLPPYSARRSRRTLKPTSTLKPSCCRQRGSRKAQSVTFWAPTSWGVTV